MTLELVSVDDMSSDVHNTYNSKILSEEETKKRSELLRLRFESVIDYFQKTNPNPTTELKRQLPHSEERGLSVMTRVIVD